MMSNIPQELIIEILARLPVKSVVRFLCVSKEWYALITSSYFIKLHLKSSIETNRDRTLILNEDEDEFSPPLRYFSAVQFSEDNQFGKTFEIYKPLQNWVISDYCDGLVCLHKGYKKLEVAIWNPLVRKYRKLPIEPIEEPSSFSSGIRFSHLAFGHDPRNDDYKVLRVTEFYMTDSMEFEVKVYSMRSNSWKRIDEQWPNKEICCQKLLALNGDVYWLAADRVVQDLESILAFNFATEKLRLYGTPVPPDDDQFTCLDVLGGCLCYIVNDYLNSDVYLMKKNGVESSWTQIFKIEQHLVFMDFEYFRTLMFSTNGKKVLLEEHQECGRTNLIWYDIEKKRCNRVKNRSFPYVFMVATCIGSLLLLDGDNVIDPRQKKNKGKRKRNYSPSESVGKSSKMQEG